MIGSLLILTSVFILMWLVLRLVFGVKVSFETPRKARKKAELRERHAREIRRIENEKLQQIVQEETEKIRKEFQRTATRLHDYTQERLTAAVSDEIKSHIQSTESARDAALETIRQSSGIFETQQKEIKQQIDKEVKQMKSVLADELDKNLVEILQTYVQTVLRDEADVDSQTRTVIQALEGDKKRIIQDLRDELA